MQSEWIRRIGIVALVGVMVLIAEGLVLMTKSAQAVPPSSIANSNNSTTSWDKNLPSDTRFTVLAAFGGAAVRDNNTGLVWEKAADSTTRTWTEAISFCIDKTVGITTGWRLPSVVELNSVRDPSLLEGFVPAVFSGVQGNRFWSATTVASNLSNAWNVDFSGGFVAIFDKGTSSWVWCVRGPMNADAY